MQHYFKDPSPFKFPIKLFRSRRKSLSIQITENMIKVRVPFFASSYSINAFICKSENWITNKIGEMEQKKPKKIQYVNGTKLNLMGQDFSLIFSSNNTKKSRIKGSKIFLSLHEKDFMQENIVKLEVSRLLKEFAEEVLLERTNHFSNLIGEKPKSIKVKEYKSKWGSCSFKGDIVYNWKIIFAPLEIIDYLVVHELCHLEHHNHSSHFWGKVEQFLSDFSTRKKWLRKHSHLLTL